MSKHIDLKTRVQNLDFAASWEQLSEAERNYAYYMSKASWAGALVTIHQISYESPLLFCLFQAYFAEKNFDELEQCALREGNGLTQEDWRKFIAYVAGFYGSLGNYLSFGQMKFVPDLSVDQFWSILGSHPKAAQQGSLIQHALSACAGYLNNQEIFSTDAPYTQLNYPCEGGVTAYFSRDVTKEDLALTQEFLKSDQAQAKGLNILNTRLFKTSESSNILTVASISTEQNCSMEFKDKIFKVQFGEFQSYLLQINKYL